MKQSWTFFEAWNKALETREKREIQPRQQIWASELGGAYVDRFLKMTGVEPTNPPDPRALRKFEAGNMMEWVVEQVLKRAGVFIEAQEWVDYTIDGLLPVSGRLDFLAGGTPDWEKAKEEIERLNLPEFFGRATQAVITHFKENYPDGLKQVVIEVKSCSSYMYEKYKNGASHHHKLQALHYLLAKGMDESHLIYISKDDLRMLEVGVFPTPDLIEAYTEDVKTITNYIQKNERPPLEKEIVYDSELEKFTANWKVGYSNYLTMLYGYKDQAEFEAKTKPIVTRLNRVLTRIKQGKKLTDDNKKAIEEMKQYANLKEIGLEVN